MLLEEAAALGGVRGLYLAGDVAQAQEGCTHIGQLALLVGKESLINEQGGDGVVVAEELREGDGGFSACLGACVVSLRTGQFNLNNHVEELLVGRWGKVG